MVKHLTILDKHKVADIPCSLSLSPQDLCEDEEFRAILLDLKHKHDIIMKSQLKHKTSLCRRTSSAGSRGYVLTSAGVVSVYKLGLS